MFLRLKSEVFRHKSNALDYIIRRRHRRRIKARFRREREGKRERIRELRNGRETETKFKSSRRGVQEVYAGGVVTLETHSNVTYDYY